MQLAFVILSLLVTAQAALAVTAVTDIRINYLSNARGVDDPVAVFTWCLPQDRNGSAAQQLAARVVVVAAYGGDVAFDSGMVATDQPQLSNSPPLPPMALHSDAVYTWWVEVLTPPGASVVRSDNATFTTGVLTQQEWAAAGAQWIRGGNGSTQMRKEFVVPAGALAARATLFVAACQYYVRAFAPTPTPTLWPHTAHISPSTRLVPPLTPAPPLPSGPTLHAFPLPHAYYPL